MFFYIKNNQKTSQIYISRYICRLSIILQHFEKNIKINKNNRQNGAKDEQT